MNVSAKVTNGGFPMVALLQALGYDVLWKKK